MRTRTKIVWRRNGRRNIAKIATVLLKPTKRFIIVAYAYLAAADTSDTTVDLADLLSAVRSKVARLREIAQTTDLSRAGWPHTSTGPLLRSTAALAADVATTCRTIRTHRSASTVIS